MTREFMDGNFLLTTRAAERLYHDYAKDMPIYDYHSHLPARQIVEDARFGNITQVWLYGDHYKWRAMRACGIAEPFVSGIPDAADDYARFAAWAKVVPQTMGNPLFHWTHLELRRYFGVTRLLTPATAREIYDACGGMLASPEFTVRSIIRRSNVALVCTTDDPTDDLADHLALAQEDWGCAVYPAWRPDRAIAADNSTVFNTWLDVLEGVSGKSIASYQDMLDALELRHRYFHEAGCRLSDYGMERPFAVPYTDAAVNAAFGKARSGISLGGDELEQYRSAVLYDLMCLDASKNWTQQLHLGVRRNNSTKAFAALGPDAGYDSISDAGVGRGLADMLNRLESAGSLARTIVYALNPRDNDMAASILGSFQDGITPGKMQIGTAWWHNDHKDGMLRQMSALANIGLLSLFVGMLTDSRSFLSYPRHEYFRRILCAMLGRQMENGELPGDFELVGSMVKDICFNNAVRYFGLALPAGIAVTANAGERS